MNMLLPLDKMSQSDLDGLAMKILADAASLNDAYWAAQGILHEDFFPSIEGSLAVAAKLLGAPNWDKFPDPKDDEIIEKLEDMGYDEDQEGEFFSEWLCHLVGVDSHVAAKTMVAAWRGEFNPFGRSESVEKRFKNYALSVSVITKHSRPPARHLPED